MGNDSTSREPVHAMALTAGPGNIEALFGLKPRTAYRTAERLGVPIWRIGTKRLIPVDLFMAALEREAMKNVPPPSAELSEEAAQDALLAKLGLRRVGGRP